MASVTWQHRGRSVGAKRPWTRAQVSADWSHTWTFHSSFCSQMTGVWYEIARTRFTFNTMESVISIYEYNSDMDHLDGLFTGTLEYCSFCDLLEKKCASQCNDRGSHLTMEVALPREMQVRTVRLCLRTMPDWHIWCQFRWWQVCWKGYQNWPSPFLEVCFRPVQLLHDCNMRGKDPPQNAFREIGMFLVEVTDAFLINCQGNGRMGVKVMLWMCVSWTSAHVVVQSSDFADQCNTKREWPTPTTTC